MTDFETRVRELEAEGLTTSDAQSVAEAEDIAPPQPRYTREEEKFWKAEVAGIYLCEACGSDDPRPVTHKTWCSVRILEPSLHRFAKDLTGGGA